MGLLPAARNWLGKVVDLVRANCAHSDRSHRTVCPPGQADNTTMQILQGIAVSPGIAIGEALIVDNEGFRIPGRFVLRDAVEDELKRLDLAIEAVAGEIRHNRDTVTQQLGDQYGAIFSAHLQMLRDPMLHDELESLIRQQHHSAEYAVSRTLRRYAKVFQQLDNVYLAERAHDVFDLESSLLANLLGRRRESLADLEAPAIVLAHNLTPNETARMNRDFVLSFVTEAGGPGSHTAIIAKALEIPAVVGTGIFLADVSGGDLVIVDGDHGQVILHPDQETLDRYKQEIDDHRSLAQRLAGLKDQPAETIDGTRIELLANIEFPHEMQACLDRGAEGIGLYRTEFLYLGAESEPTEEDHFQAYAEVIRAMGQLPVVIRTVDLGADKMGQFPHTEEEHNPFLGVRSIRLSLRNLDLFRIQLRAIARASALGQVKVMFPLISTLDELRQAKMVLADTVEDIRDEGIECADSIPIGMMVEVPSAVIMIDKLVQEVDFLSIGTNDLTQYALAVDRTNKDMASLYRASDPSVLRLIDVTLRAARAAGVTATVCGEMSSNPAHTLLLLGLGLRSMSIAPGALPEIKQICRTVSLGQCESIAERAMEMDSAREIDAYLQEQLRKVAPELVF
jgi:phosphotransferase system enzyme I (PtsI)